MPGCKRRRKAASRRSARSGSACTRHGKCTTAPRRWTTRCSAKTSRPHEAAMSQLREFVADLMEHRGAVVEAMDPDMLEVLVPAPVREDRKSTRLNSSHL